MIPIVILAGGLGTRLNPVTKKIPKSLVPVCGTPFIHHQLTLLYKKGIRDVVICTGYLGERIEEYVGDGSRWKLNITMSYDGDTQLGTGGAIKKALPLLPENFFITYGDSYLTTNYHKILSKFLGSPKPCLMTYFDGIEYGLSTFNREVFETPIIKFDLWDVFIQLQLEDQVEYYFVDEPFYEIGSFEGIKKLEDYLCNT